MSDNKDYSQWALDELRREEKKIKRKEITSAVIIGFLIGVIVFGVAKNGIGFTYIFIPAILIIGIIRNAQYLKQNLKQVRAEINAKDAK